MSRPEIRHAITHTHTYALRCLLLCLQVCGCACACLLLFPRGVLCREAVRQPTQEILFCCHVDIPMPDALWVAG